MMSVTSFHFYCMFALSLAVYYMIPRKFQWLVLLMSSIYFFVQSSGWKMGIIFLPAVIVTGCLAVKINRFQKARKEKLAKRAVVFGIFVNTAILAVLKYNYFFVYNWNILMRFFRVPLLLEAPHLNAPIGISFYTLMSVGYLADVYWGITEAEKNPFKMVLLLGYYPHMTSGPVSRIQELRTKLFGGGYKFDYETAAFGIQRMLWGVFKKLVISERAAILVNAIYADQETYKGLYVWAAAFLFMLQLYTDFSGCMDIMLGASECYGIILPENFHTPFFSASVQEYWQRWHITLGEWLKDYIMYPLMRTEILKRLTRWLNIHAGRKASVQIPSYLAMLCVWLLIGLWHGGAWKYILGMGLWFWSCITLGRVLEPFFKKIKLALKMDIDNFGWHLFQSLRVFFLAAVGNIFFRVDGMSAALSEIKNGFSFFNPWIFFDGSFVQMGLSYRDQNILIFGTFLLFLVSVLQEKYGGARLWMRKQFFLFRWSVWIFLFLFVLTEGTYGPGYSAAEFIYRGF